jgi:hypothetical protein
MKRILEAKAETEATDARASGVILGKAVASA